MSGDTAIRITGMRTVGVPVLDQDRALEFYTTRLGLTNALDVASAAARAGSRSRQPERRHVRSRSFGAKPGCPRAWRRASGSAQRTLTPCTPTCSITG